MRLVPSSVAMLVALLAANSALAGFTQYGTGCPDSSTVAPVLSMSGQDIPGGAVTLSFDGGAANSYMLLMLGFGQAAIPMGFGCTLNVSPLFPVPIGPLPLDANGDISFATTLPDTLPAPFTFMLQAFEADPAMTSGFGNSNGVQIDLNVPAPPSGLVINELDYDQPGTDTTEFIEIYNPTANAISLTGVQLIFINGNAGGFAPYLTYDLSPSVSLGAGQYLVVANPGVVVDPGAILMNFATASNSIQNGSPDGIALVDTVNGVYLDGISYEGVTGTGTVPGVLNPVNCNEGTSIVPQDIGQVGSLIRFPNGYDSNNGNFDWRFSVNMTPGAANQL